MKLRRHLHSLPYWADETPQGPLEVLHRWAQWVEQPFDPIFASFSDCGPADLEMVWGWLADEITSDNLALFDVVVGAANLALRSTLSTLNSFAGSRGLSFEWGPEITAILL